MKRTRRLAWLLLVAMVISLCPTAAFADEGETHEHDHAEEIAEVIEPVAEPEPISEPEATEAPAEPEEAEPESEESEPESEPEPTPEPTAEPTPEPTEPAEEPDEESVEESTEESTEPEAPDVDEAVAAVQALIDALPTVDTVTADDYDAVQAVYDAYDALSEEQQATIVGAEVFEELLAWFNGQTMSVKSVPEITYITADGTASATAYEKLENGSSGTQGEGIYYVPDELTMNSDLSFTGNTTLVLGDGVTLTVEGVLSCDKNLTITTVENAKNAVLTVKGGTREDGNGYGIYTDSSLSIYAGTINATGGNVMADSTNSYGIYVAKGSLTISGSGTSVTATGGTASRESYGIYRAVGSGSICITGGTVNATGGTVNATGGTASSRSYGIRNLVAFSIDGSAQVTAKGGNAEDSYGISTTGTMTVSGTARLTAEGDKINKTQNSNGIRCGTITVSGNAELTGEGGNVTNVSCGVECTAITINGSAQVTAGAGTSDGNYSVGIDASDTVNISGGTVKATGGTAKYKSYGIWAGSVSISDAKMTAYSESLTEESTDAKSSGICVMQGNGDSIAQNILSIDQTEGKETMIYGKDNGPVSLSAYTLTYNNGTFKLATDSTFTYSLAGQGDFASLLPIGYAFAYKYSMEENEMTPEPRAVTPGPILLKLCDHTDNNGSSARENGKCKFCGANCNGKHDYVTSWGGCSSGCADGTVCQHTTLNENGYCSTCQTQFRTKLTAGSNTFWAMNVSALMEKRAENAANTVTLYSDYSDLNSMPTFTTTGTAWTLDLNGHLYDGYIHVGESTTAGSLTVSNSGTASWKSSIYGIRLVNGTAKLDVGVYLSLAEVPTGSTLGVLLPAGAAFEKHVSSGDTYALFDTTGVTKYTGELRVVSHTSHTYDSTTGKCACGATCLHTTIGDNGKCATCQHQMALKRENGTGETTTTAWFDTISAALTDVAANTKVQLCLYADVSAGDLTDGNLELLIDLDGHTLTANVTVNNSFELKSQRSGGKLDGTVMQTGGRLILYGVDTTVTGLVTLGGTVNLLEGVTFAGGVKTTVKDATLMDYLNGAAFATIDAGGIFGETVIDGSVTELTGEVKTVAHTHTYDSTTGKCPCGAMAAVCVTGGGVTTGYESFADAYTAANNGDTIKLFSNVSDAMTINDSSKKITLDLNGKTVSSLTVSVPATITDSAGGGTITTLTTGGSVKIGGLLAAGCGFKSGSAWYDSSSEATSVSSVSVGKLPIQGRVTISSKNKNTTYNMATDPVPYTYGDSEEFTASVALADGYSLEGATYEWKNDGGDLPTTGCTASGSKLSVTFQQTGNYNFTCSVTVDGYTATTAYGGQCEVGKATLTEGTDYTAPTAQSGLTYNGTEQQLLSAAGTHPTGTQFLYSLDNANWKTDFSAIKGKDAKDYTVYWELNGANYEKITGSFTVAVAPATLTATASVNTKTYDGNTSATADVTFTGLQGSDALTLATDYTVSAAFDNANAGDAKTVTVTVTLADTVSNYQLANGGIVTTTARIEKATPTISAATASVIYGQTVADGDITANAGDIAGSFTWMDVTDYGDASETAKRFYARFTPSDTKNYNTVENIPVSVTVGKAASALISHPLANELTYTGEAQALISAGTATGGELEYSLNNTDWSKALPTGTDAGGYTVYYRVKGDANHSDLTSSITVQPTIAKAALTVTAKPHGIAYGDAPANDGVEYSGFVNGETEAVLGGTLAYDYSYTQYGGVGSYTITTKGLTSNNYAIAFHSGTLTVAQKEIGIDWTNTSLIFNGGEQKPTATATGLVNGDVCAITVTGGKTNVGDYTATASALENGNYKLPESNTTPFSIVKAPAQTPAGETRSIKYADDEEKTVDLSAKMPANAGALSYAVGTITGEAAETIRDAEVDKDGKLTFALDAGESDVNKTAVIPVVITSENYEPSTVNVTVVVEKREVPQIDLNDRDFKKTYDGKPVDLPKENPKNEKGEPIPGEWRWEKYDPDKHGGPAPMSLDASFGIMTLALDGDTPAVEQPVNVADSATQWVLVFTPDDPVTYAPVIQTVNVVIEKRSLTASSKDVTGEYNGSELTNGDHSIVFDGMVDGEQFQITFTGGQTHIGSSDNSFELASTGTADLSNYDIRYEPGTLRVAVPSDTGAAVKDVTKETVTSGDSEAVQETLTVVNQYLAMEPTAEEKQALEALKAELEDVAAHLENAEAARSDDAIESVDEIDASNAKPSDKTTLTEAKDAIEKALEDFGSNYTEAEKKELTEKLEQIESALKTIEKTEQAEQKAAQRAERLAARTGDAATPILYLAVLVLAVGTLIVLVVVKRKKQK